IRHTSNDRDWSSDVCSSDLNRRVGRICAAARARPNTPPTINTCTKAVSDIVQVLIVGGVFGLALAAAQILPTLELLPRSIRSGRSEERRVGATARSWAGARV